MPPSRSQNVYAITCILFLVSLASPVHSKDNEAFDIQAALHYLPSKAIAAAGFSIYFIINCFLLWRLIRNRDWWGLCLPIGGFCEAAGFLLRIFITRPPLRTSLGWYILMDSLIVLAPAAFLAFNYITYGRLVRFCAGREHSFIRPEIVGRTFVISDIFTFLVQGSGGGLEVQAGTATLGKDIFLIGIIAQGASYVLYVFIVALAHRSVSKTIVSKGHDPRNEPWWKIFPLLYFSSFFIIIRSIYRVVETVQGQNGYLLTHEWCFFVFDSIPLAFATGIYILFWPGNYIPKQALESSTDTITPEGGMVLKPIPSSPVRSGTILVNQ